MSLYIIALLIAMLGGLIWAILDTTYEADLRVRREVEAFERRREQGRRDVLASQRTLARAGYYKGPIEGPGAGVTGAHHREAMNAWAKDVWSGINAPHGSPERNRLNRIAGHYDD